MSQENVEIVRRQFEAINRADWDALVKYAAPDFKYDLSRAVGPLHGVYDLDQARQAIESSQSHGSLFGMRQTNSSKLASTS